MLRLVSPLIVQVSVKHVLNVRSSVSLIQTLLLDEIIFDVVALDGCSMNNHP